MKGSTDAYAPDRPAGLPGDQTLLTKGLMGMVHSIFDNSLKQTHSPASLNLHQVRNGHPNRKPLAPQLPGEGLRRERA